MRARGSGGSPRDPFLARHPPTAERRETLRDYAARAIVTGEPRVGRDDYLARLRPIRRWLLTDEVRSRRFAASEILLQHLIDDGDGLGELHFHVGEIHRLRGSPGDLPKAIAAYRRALELPDGPAEPCAASGPSTFAPATARPRATRSPATWNEGRTPTIAR